MTSSFTLRNIFCISCRCRTGRDRCGRVSEKAAEVQGPALLFFFGAEHGLQAVKAQTLIEGELDQSASSEVSGVIDSILRSIPRIRPRVVSPGMASA